MYLITKEKMVRIVFGTFFGANVKNVFEVKPPLFKSNTSFLVLYLPYVIDIFKILNSKSNKIKIASALNKFYHNFSSFLISRNHELH